jgi:peptidoglycan/LPS O-acetylase OafA/YrhL
MRNISILEGLRGWLASWVMVSHIMHYCSIYPDSHKGHLSRAILGALKDGRSAVWIFMILSGFVNFYLLDAKSESPLVYIFRRFLRLYPLYIVLYVASIFLNEFNLYSLHTISWSQDPWIAGQFNVTTKAYHYLWENLLVHMTMLQGLVPSAAWPSTTSAFLGVAWSISTEWQFYLLASGLFYLARKKNGLNWLGLLAILCSWSLSNRLLSNIFLNDNPSFLIFKWQFFYVGMASYLFYKQIIYKKMPDGYPPYNYLIFGLIMIYLVSFEPVLLLWCAIFTLVIIHHYFPEDRWIGRFSFIFTNKYAQYFGRISYSIYLFHWLAIMIVMRLMLVFAPNITVSQAPWIMFPGVVLLTCFGAHFLYHYLEKPFIDCGKRLFKRSPEQPGRIPLLDSLEAAKGSP